MHPNITHEIGRLQIDDMVSQARLARLARRVAAGGAAVPSRARRAHFLRARALRVTPNA